ncbi:hypothetical protein ASD50_20705 [Mesorhizobium sp. Root552]|uniref:Ish1 domain-containing protein n=1 Tax=Mesorhizobium sp. Root552 TaxID=1736555 RepID=UPI0006F61EF9|nr:Ish1 domain-containing protein [Mesorhizobium sp. Root552]KQZ25846.1 hypothetical protein ASD50_20705 [Mesorhizobium sp. Root552]
MANDDLIAPRFFTRPVENPIETRKQGRPIFEDREFVEVKFAGNRQSVLVAPAHEKFKQRKMPNGDSEWITYAQEYQPIYERFKQGLSEQGSGTPLSELPFLTEAKRSELKALNVKSAEALAALDGGPLKMLGMGGRELKNQAIAYLEKASGSADLTRLAAENEAYKTRMEDMQREIEELRSAQAPKAATKAKAKAKKDAEPSPFDDFEDDDIRNWLKDSGFECDPAWDRETLVAKADEANAELADKQKVA